MIGRQGRTTPGGGLGLGILLLICKIPRYMGMYDGDAHLRCFCVMIRLNWLFCTSRGARITSFSCWQRACLTSLRVGFSRLTASYRVCVCEEMRVVGCTRRCEISPFRALPDREYVHRGSDISRFLTDSICDGTPVLRPLLSARDRCAGCHCGKQMSPSYPCSLHGSLASV